MNATTTARERAASASSPYPEIPDGIELGADAKKQVIGGVKTVLVRLQDRGLATAGKDYATVIGNAGLLHEAILAYKANRDIADDIARDAKGAPLRDDGTPTACGITIAQIIQMLVFTCAKRLFTEADAKPAPKVQPAGRSLASLFRRKPAEPAPIPAGKSDGEKKLAELRPLLAFDWQLPLLKFYYFLFNRSQLMELGRDILLLPEIESLEKAAGFTALQMRKARQVTDADFAGMLMANPQAMAGLNHWDEAKYPLFRAALGERIWDFYARDLDYFDKVADVERERIEILGPLLADLSGEAVEVLERLKDEKLVWFLKEFRRVFGAEVPLLLGDGLFARQMLLPVVQNFSQLETRPDRFAEAVHLKCTALQPMVAQWLEKRRADAL